MPRPTLPCLYLLIAAVALVPGCTTAQRSHNTSAVLGARTTARSSNIIRATEIQSARVENAHDAVMRLRPEFLRRRDVPAAGDPTTVLPMIYVDGVRQGGPDMLRSIPVAAIFEICYLSGTTASDRFGPYYAGGVIAVRTRR